MSLVFCDLFGSFHRNGGRTRPAFAEDGDRTADSSASDEPEWHEGCRSDAIVLGGHVGGIVGRPTAEIVRSDAGNGVGSH